jgi:hypothetical protein
VLEAENFDPGVVGVGLYGSAVLAELEVGVESREAGYLAEGEEAGGADEGADEFHA